MNPLDSLVIKYKSHMLLLIRYVITNTGHTKNWENVWTIELISECNFQNLVITTVVKSENGKWVGSVKSGKQMCAERQKWLNCDNLWNKRRWINWTRLKTICGVLTDCNLYRNDINEKIVIEIQALKMQLCDQKM